jgi:hypothetical protein
VRDASAEGDAEALRLSEAQGEEEKETAREGEPEAEGRGEREPEPVAPPVGDSAPLRDVCGLSVAVFDARHEGVSRGEPDAETGALSEGVPRVVRDALREEEGEGVGEREAWCEGDARGEAEKEPLPLPVREGAGEPLGGARVALGARLPLGDGDAEGSPLGGAEALAKALQVPEPPL